MSLPQRPWNFGIIYAASSASSLPTYVDAKGVTQSYIAMPTVDFTEMTTVITGDVDTSKPYAGAFIALTLSCDFGFVNATSYKIKLQCKRYDETIWKDLQIARQSDPGTIAAEQTITPGAPVSSLVFQTGSAFSAQQIRIVALAVNGGPASAGDYILIRGEVQ